MSVVDFHTEFVTGLDFNLFLPHQVSSTAMEANASCPRTRAHWGLKYSMPACPLVCLPVTGGHVLVGP